MDKTGCSSDYSRRALQSGEIGNSVMPANRITFTGRPLISLCTVQTVARDALSNNTIMTSNLQKREGRVKGRLSLPTHRHNQMNIRWLCLTSILGVLLLLGGVSQAGGDEHVVGSQGVVQLFAEEGIQKSRRPDGRALKKRDSSAYMVVGMKIPSGQSFPMVSAESTEPAFVQTIMALLATFESAGILPAEGNPEANQLIHGLIQFQSVMVKSRSPALNEYLSAAVAQESHLGTGDLRKTIDQNGLTSQILEAIVTYDRKRPIWNQLAIVPILQSYNISRGDWELISRMFTQADAVYRAQGSSIHEEYEQWRTKLRGGRQNDSSGVIKKNGLAGFD